MIESSSKDLSPWPQTLFHQFKTPSVVSCHLCI